MKLRNAELWHREAQEGQLRGNLKLVLLERPVREVAEGMRAEQGRRLPPADSDRLRSTLRTLPGLDQHRLGAVWHLAAQLNLGCGLQTVAECCPEVELRLGALRQAAMDLATEACVADLRARDEAEPDTPPAQQAHERQQLMTRLRRLRPGASTATQAIRHEDGRVFQKPGGPGRSAHAGARVFRGWPFCERGLRSGWKRRALRGGPPGLARQRRSRVVTATAGRGPGSEACRALFAGATAPRVPQRALGAYGPDALCASKYDLSSAFGTH